MERLLTVSDVAKRLGVHPDKVYELISAGREVNGRIIKLSAINIGGAHRATWRFEPSDVQDFLTAVRVNECAPPMAPASAPLQLTRDWLA